MLQGVGEEARPARLALGHRRPLGWRGPIFRNVAKAPGGLGEAGVFRTFGRASGREASAQTGADGHSARPVTGTAAMRPDAGSVPLRGRAPEERLEERALPSPAGFAERLYVWGLTATARTQGRGAGARRKKR